MDPCQLACVQASTRVLDDARIRFIVYKFLAELWMSVRVRICWGTEQNRENLESSK